MCLAVPGRVVSIDGDTALVDFGGAKRNANVSLVKVDVGQYVIVHAGFAISVMDEREAQESLETWREFIEFSERENAEGEG